MKNSKHNRRGGSRPYLLTTVSAFALIASGIDPALATDHQPLLWIDLGWQGADVRDSNSTYSLPFDSQVQQASAPGSLVDILHLSQSHGVDGKLSFRPEDSNWVFSASVRYGRARGRGMKGIHQTQVLPTASYAYAHTSIPTYPRPYYRTTARPLRQHAKFFNADTASAESHLMMDFEAGLDVGLGMFGTSTLGVGLRVAELKSVLNIARFDAVPDPQFKEVFHSTFPTLAFFPSSTRSVPWYHQQFRQVWHNFAGSPRGSHEFLGAGPSIYWDASAPLFGDAKRGGQISFDWGVNAALLFGKQKNKEQHRTTGGEHCYAQQLCTNYQTRFTDTSQEQSTKRVTVPNLGGFMGVSYRVQDFKASFGYRADYFLRAMDTGIARQSASTRGFVGPFASISVGIGD